MLRDWCGALPCASCTLVNERVARLQFCAMCFVSVLNMEKVLKIFIPPVLGLLAVWGMFAIERIIHEHRFGLGEDGPTVDGSLIFLLLTIIGVLIQLVFTLPIWKKFENNRKVLGLPLAPFFAIICLIGGMGFSFLGWRSVFGISDFIFGSVIGIVSLASYWAVNLFTLIQLDKWIKKYKPVFANFPIGKN